MSISGNENSAQITGEKEDITLPEAIERAKQSAAQAAAMGIKSSDTNKYEDNEGDNLKVTKDLRLMELSEKKRLLREYE